MKNTNQSLLLLMILAIGLAGCCRNKDRCKKECTTTRKNRTGTVVDMPVNKHAKNELKTQLFDENVDAFILDEDAVHATADMQKNTAFAANEDDISWQDADEPTEVAQTILFDYDRSAVSAKQKEQIAANLDQLKQMVEQGKTVVLKGHSCRAGKASGAYNLALSNDRAYKAAEMLAQAGIPKDQMKVFGVGYEELSVIEETPTRDGQAPNRRVEIYTINA